MNAKTWVLWAVLALIVIFAAVTYSRLASRLPHEITIASGSEVGMYHQLALKLKEGMERHHPRIKVDIRSTAGSAENLQLLLSGEVDFAFHQNSGETHPDIRGVANLYSEVVHLVARCNTEVQSVLDLKGKRVSVGADGSGTSQMAEEILGHFNMGVSDVEAQNLSFSEIRAAFRRDELDAAFIVSGILSPALTELLRTGEYDLVPIHHAEALTFKNPTLFAYHIPQTAYSGNPAVPAEDIKCIAVKASLITHEQTPAYMVRTMTQTALSILFRKQMHLRELTEDFARDEQDFPMHRGSQEYFSRGKPKFSSSIAEAFRDSLPYLLILSVLVIVIGATLRQRFVEKKRLLQQRLHEIMVQVSDIEEDQRGETDKRQLLRVLDQLSRIKKRTIEDHVQGRLIAGFEHIAFMMQLDGLINTIHGKLTALEGLEAQADKPEESTQ